jgi:hypothetical protein
VTGTFLFLTRRSMRNRAARRIRRLRQPRYVAGLVVGLGYLYWAVLRNQFAAAREGSSLLSKPVIASALPAVVAAVGLVLWLVVLVAWFWPSSEPPLKFSAAEVQFFYTAPVTRRQLLHYKLLRSQLGVALGVLLASALSGALAAASAGRWTLLVGALVLFSALRLHLLGVSLARATLGAGVSSVPVRAWLPPAVMAVLSALIVAPMVVRGSELLSLGGARLVGRLLVLVQAPPASAGLWPFTSLVAPVLAPPTIPFLVALAPALALLGLNYWWVLQSDAVLGDAVSATERQLASGRRRLPAPGARRPPFRLAPVGPAETALLWKNLILLGRYASARGILRVLALVVVLSTVVATSRAAGALASLGLALAGFIVLIGPYMVRNDLRHDMTRLALLKTWPVRGWSLVLGELLAPTVLLTLLAWTSLAVALAASGGLGVRWASFGERAALSLAAVSLAPALIAAQLLIQNTAVVLFPGWIPTGASRPRGIEAMGQQMLMLAGTLLALVVGVLPAAAIAGALGFVLYRLAGIAGLIPAALLFVLVLFLEAAVAIIALGHVLERTEPSQVDGGED